MAPAGAGDGGGSGVDGSIAAGVRATLARNEQLRAVDGGDDPDVEHALAILRHKGLWPGSGTPTTVPSSVASEAGDAEMAEGTAAITRRLDSDETYKKQFEDMCAAGDVGADVKRLFAAVSERQAKKARAETYTAGALPSLQDS